MEIEHDLALKTKKKTKKKSGVSLLKSKIRCVRDKEFDTKVKLIEELRKSVNSSRCSVKRSSSQPSPKKAALNTNRDTSMNLLENISNESFDLFKLRPCGSTSNNVIPKKSNISFSIDKKKHNKENESLKEEVDRLRKDNKMLKQHIKHTKESYQDSLEAQKTYYELEIQKFKDQSCKLQESDNKLLGVIEEEFDRPKEAKKASEKPRLERKLKKKSSRLNYNEDIELIISARISEELKNQRKFCHKCKTSLNF